MPKCWFGRHVLVYWSERGGRYRGCTRCGKLWRRVRYDMTIMWERERTIDGAR